MTDLGTLGGDYSFAYGINDAGQVVGYSDTAAGDQHAFITGPNGVGMTDLNSLVSLPGGTVLTDAQGINNLGQVVSMLYPRYPRASILCSDACWPDPGRIHGTAKAPAGIKIPGNLAHIGCRALLPHGALLGIRLICS